MVVNEADGNLIVEFSVMAGALGSLGGSLNYLFCCRPRLLAGWRTSRYLTRMGHFGLSAL